MTRSTRIGALRAARRHVGALLAPAVIAMVLSFATVASSNEHPDTWVVMVNGEPISVRLFQRRMVRNRASAYQYFRQKYGAEDSADFWTTPYDGEAPLEWIKQKTLDECVRIKIEQVLARDHGVIADAGYGAFLSSLERENERRRKALAAGEPIYGPQQYAEDTYFTYSFTNMVLELKKRLSKGGELFALDATLLAYYESVKDELYDRGDRVTVWAIEISFGQREGESEGLTREEARAEIEGVKARLDRGDRFEDLAGEYNDSGSLNERTMDDDTARFDWRRRPHTREHAMKLGEGEASDIFEEGGAFCILKCAERNDLGYMPFDEVKGNVRTRYTDEKYEEMADRLVRDAQVEINRPVYDRITVR